VVADRVPYEHGASEIGGSPICLGTRETWKYPSSESTRFPFSLGLRLGWSRRGRHRTAVSDWSSAVEFDGVVWPSFIFAGPGAIDITTGIISDPITIS